MTPNSKEINSKDKLRDLVDALEMNYYAADEVDQSDFDMLMQWNTDMKVKGIHVRSHLVQHLKNIGLNRVAERMKVAKFHEPLRCPN